MLKKYGILAASFFMCASALCADGNDMKNNKDMKKQQDPNHLTGGFVLGFNTSNLDGAGVNLGYYGSCWLVDVSANYSHINFHLTDTRVNYTNVVGHLGLRNRVCHNLFVDYGAMGLGQFLHSHGNSANGWGVGAFVGLSYQLSKDFLIAGKTYPYNYLHSKLAHSKAHQVFANGTLAFLYVF
ncbi:MAG: hypothetical protein ABSA17_01205 [Rhabdochlamydiaceae bacterium]